MYKRQGEQIWNSACTEPGAGSDVGALATTYKRENGKIYLNGTKTFITSSAGVKYLVIICLLYTSSIGVDSPGEGRPRSAPTEGSVPAYRVML